MFGNSKLFVHKTKAMTQHYMIRFSWRKGKSIGFIAFSDGTLEAYVYVCVPTPMACRDFVEILRSAKSTMKRNINTNKIKTYFKCMSPMVKYVHTRRFIHIHFSIVTRIALNSKCGF